MKLENYLKIVSLTESLEIVMIEVSRNFNNHAFRESIIFLQNSKRNFDKYLKNWGTTHQSIPQD